MSLRIVSLSVRLTIRVCLACSGVTAEEFIGARRPTVGKTRYDQLRHIIAARLNISVANVNIFTVLNHPRLGHTIDVRYSAHGSPYYRPSRLNALLSINKAEVLFLLFFLFVRCTVLIN